MAVETTVQQLLDTKSKMVYTIEPDATVLNALSVLADAGIGALPVSSSSRGRRGSRRGHCFDG